MFVRWKRKRRKDQFTGDYRLTGEYREMPPYMVRLYPEQEGKSYPVKERIVREEWLLSASLVESYRNAEGKPRQRTVCYLGSIREKYIDPKNEYSIFHRGYFWNSVDANFSKVTISDLERAHIVATLEETAPRPGTEEMEAYGRARDERIAAVMRMAGTR